MPCRFVALVSSRRLSRLLLGAVLACATAPFGGFAQILRNFQPSGESSLHGTVSIVRDDTGLVDLPAGFLAHSPAGGERTIAFDESIWIVGYRTEIYDQTGSAPEENYLCHTFLGDRPFTQRHEPRMLAIYTDSFTRQVRLPDGFGIHVPARTTLNWLTLFNNRSANGARVGMRMAISLIRDADLTRPLTPLYATLHSTSMPHLFYVPPRRHQQEVTVDLEFQGRIHFMGVHVHPYATSVELHNASRDERVWKGEARHGESGEMIGFDTYSSQEGYAVRPGEAYRVTSVYDNPTDRDIDAMAGLFVMYSLDGQQPATGQPVGN